MGLQHCICQAGEGVRSAAHHTQDRGAIGCTQVETQVYSTINATVWPEGRN